MNTEPEIERHTPAAWLVERYRRKRKKNPLYSRRAFARALGVSSGRLSELMAGTRNVGSRVASRIETKLGLLPSEQARWRALVRQHAHSTARARRITSLTHTEYETGYQPLPSDVLGAVRDWQHFALLNLLETSDFKSDPVWMAARLSLPVEKVKTALRRLERLGLIRQKNGVLTRSRLRLGTTHDLPSESLREAHRQKLKLAARALSAVKVGERDITSICMAISPTRLPEAKRIIRDFRRSLAELLEAGERTEVYNLSIALFPLSVRSSQ